MPNKFIFDTDSAALAALDENFHVSGFGLITRNTSRYIPSEQEEAAINYLCTEWDYDYTDNV